ncbi:MAG: MarR family winged helix-turn-helix transcriptional regulator [Clostridiales bacterium]|nr:MarR family winged helix-turn-helix transcriptional regulator [Clostridiales bacterium]
MDDSTEKRMLYLMQQIYVMLTSLTKNFDKLDNKQDKGLTARQFVTVMAIQHAAHGEATMAKVAKMLGTTKQNMNHLIPVLEKKGYLEKTVSDNGRGTQIQVTDAGVEAILDYAGSGLSILAEVFEGLTESDMETLLQLLQKLYSMDRMEYPCFESSVMQLIEAEYPDRFASLLEEYHEKRAPRFPDMTREAGRGARAGLSRPIRALPYPSGQYTIETAAK